MTCQEFIALIADYLEMTVTPEALAELEEHLAGCGPCQAYLKTYRRTRELTAASERTTLPPSMPSEMKAHLRTFLLAQARHQES